MPFEFIADHPVLDYVATLAERGTTDAEHLRQPADLASWVRQSGLLDVEPTVTSEQLTQARAVREALFGLIRARIDGRAYPPADRDLVNRAAAEPALRVELGPDGSVTRTGQVESVLALLALDCLDLLGGPDAELLHWCADTRCTRPFVDRSRGGRRRWCGMRGCGDRAKAAAYRARRRGEVSPAGTTSQKSGIDRR